MKAICAAVLHEGKMYVGRHHGDIVEGNGMPEEYKHMRQIKYFVTDEGQFVPVVPYRVQFIKSGTLDQMGYILPKYLDVKQGQKIADEYNKAAGKAAPDGTPVFACTPPPVEPVHRSEFSEVFRYTKSPYVKDYGHSDDVLK